MREMREVPRYRHLVGYRGDRLTEQLNNVDALQDLFGGAIPPSVVEFVAALPNCVLYYRFDATTKTGRTKTYSDFVTTNIGPELESYHPFPASLIGHVQRNRSMGMGTDYLPIMMDFRKASWIFCNIANDASICVPEVDGGFAAEEREWIVITHNFESFIGGLQLDLRPLLSIFRLAGTGNVTSSMRDWLLAVVGRIGNWKCWHRLICNGRNQSRDA